SMSFKKNGVAWILFNFVVLAIAGALLRYMHCFSLPVSINYQFLLHSHSHFAFAGWMFLAIILLLFYHFKNEYQLSQITYNRIFVATLLVSLGMLVSFFLTGYKTISIILSTSFIFIGYWAVFVAFKSNTVKPSKSSPVSVLLKSALFFMVISSLGPFGLGYLKSIPFKSLALQQNAIYFYLHFQLNGFMQLALLGLLFKSYFKSMSSFNKSDVFWTKLLVVSTLPMYAIFTLWHKPATWVYILAFAGALVHFIAWCMLLYKLRKDLKPLSFLARASLLAVSLQFFFQLLVTIPAIGNWVFGSRNLIVGYMHLITLGSLSPIILDLLTRAGFIKRSLRLNYAFIIFTALYLVLLFGSGFLTLFKIHVPNLAFYLLATNLLLALVALAYFINYAVSNNVLFQNKNTL
ncbi:MAG TPA: hypothetical protein VFM79_00700, partial [Pelobium sp.]|nr:hypothetical protein [Pelobium sp.]